MDDQPEERIQGAKERRIQVRRVRPTEFTRAKRQVFLNTLAATCNIATSAATAGIGRMAAHRLRRTSPEFAALWEEALEIGYAHLEEQLLARAIEGVDAMTIDPDAAPISALPPIGVGSEEQSTAAFDAPPRPGSFGLAAIAGTSILSGRGLPVAYQLALMMLNQRRAALAIGPRGGRRKKMTTQEVDALLIQKLDRLDRLTRQKADRAAAAAAAAAASEASAPPLETLLETPSESGA